MPSPSLAETRVNQTHAISIFPCTAAAASSRPFVAWGFEGGPMAKQQGNGQEIEGDLRFSSSKEDPPRIRREVAACCGRQVLLVVYQFAGVFVVEAEGGRWREARTGRRASPAKSNKQQQQPCTVVSTVSRTSRTRLASAASR